MLLRKWASRGSDPPGTDRGKSLYFHRLRVARRGRESLIGMMVLPHRSVPCSWVLVMTIPRISGFPKSAVAEAAGALGVLRRRIRRRPPCTGRQLPGGSRHAVIGSQAPQGRVKTAEDESGLGKGRIFIQCRSHVLDAEDKVVEPDIFVRTVKIGPGVGNAEGDGRYS